VVGERVEVDLALSLSQLQQSVTVTERPDLVAVTTEDVSGLVNERQVKELPLNGRSYDQLLTLNPGVVNYTIAARRGDRNVEFGGGQHVRGFGPPPSGQSLHSEWRGIHERLGNQHHTGRRERAAAGSGCGARILGVSKHVRCGVWKAAGRRR